MKLEQEGTEKTENQIKIDLNGKIVDIQKIKNKVCSLKSSTSCLLRNVEVISSCYSPGQFVFVTVGVKPSILSKVCDK